MKPYFCAVLSFAVVLVHAQTPVWTQFPNSPPGTANRNDDISFVDLTNGWSARGTNGIYRTTNCGQSWFSITPHLVTNVAHFRSIGFASPTRGWAGNLGPGAYDGTVTDTNLLYETFDGGNTWGIVQAINNSGMKGFCAMHIKDDQHIYGVGRVRGPAFFAKSEDGGNNWFVTNLTAAGVMGGLMDVYFMNTNLGFTVGMDTNLFTLDQTAGPPYYGSIARTTNGGLNWQVMATVKVPYSYFWKMSWPTTNIGYVSLQQNTNYSSFVFYKTTDGGQTWVSNGIPLSTLGTSSFELQGIGFVSTNEGWLGGGALSPPNNFIHTTNGGLTWTAMGYNNANNLNRFRFVSPTLGYLSGIKLHVYHIPLAAAISPAATNVPAGSNMTFSATAYGTAPMPFQWQHNGTNIAGGTTNSYTLANITADNAGSYTLVVSDFTGSATSSVATLTVISNTAAPVITTQPQSQVVNPGASATFNVSANGAAPLSYQWLFNGTNLVGATNTVYTQTNVQAANTGNYSVVVTNSSGNVTSSVALLALSFLADFDSYATPSIVTNVGTTDGYKIFFGADSGPVDFKAIFGFDYSTVTLPTNIPSAPHSIGGTTKGLYLSVNKDATGIAAGVDLYPTNIFVAGNFSLKFDMWLNWSNTGSATEHALFGINHSGNVTNRVTQITSDGLFFAVDGDGNVANTSTGERDFSVFHGAGAGAIPVLMTTGNTVFGPTLPLGNNFDNNDPGFITLFPSKMVPGYATLAGSAGLRWVSGEVRQENNLITCLLNGVAIAQYTNTYGYTNGMVLIGYNDIFASLGTTNNFVIFDNVRVEGIVYAPVKILSPQLAGSNFSFSLGTEAYESYTVQWTTNLLSPNWTDYTNFMGSGSTDSVAIPLPSNNSGAQYFRVSRP